MALLDKCLHPYRFYTLSTHIKLLHYGHAEPWHLNHDYRKQICNFVPVRLSAVPGLEKSHKIAYHHAGNKAICKLLDVSLTWDHFSRKAHWDLWITHCCLADRFQLFSITIAQTHSL